MSSIEMAEGGSAADTSPAASVEDGASQMILYPRSPPKAEVDDSPLQKSMDRNKESLKVKLMLRRPINQLVAQGIMPQLKTSPTIHEQRQKLERAKMGDLLKAKIQQRPDRQELVRQHILEADVGHVDPSLAERQRMLKKCRLVDSLNDQLSHRPGPLELIKKNILHTEEPIERAVKEGFIEFKATCEGHQIRPEPPDHYMTIDDDSQSSDAQSPNNAGNAFNVEACSSSSSSPAGSVTAIVGGTPVATAILQPMVADSIPAELFRTGASVCDALEKAAAQAGIVTVVVAPNANILAAAPSPLSSSSSTSSLSPLSAVASPAPVGSTAFTCSSAPSVPAHRPSSLPAHQQLPAPGKDKNRKKSKSKSQQQKTRQIKFHEYKGPPSAQKNSNSSSNTGSNMETSYELLLQQQQLYLQYELEAKQKGLVAEQNPASPSLISLPSPSVSSQRSANESSSQPALNPPPPPPPLPPPPTPVATAAANRPLRNLEDMKVSDLKAELKKRNLRVSGPKPHLIERLKLYAGVATNSISNSNVIANQNHVQSSSHPSIPFTIDDSIADSQTNTVTPMNGVETSLEPNAKSNSPPPPPQMQDLVDATKTKGATPSEMNNNEPSEDIIREKERQIKELQRQLLNSQLLLQKQRQQQQQMLQLARSSQTFQPQQTINAKANLAAFLHQNQLAQQLQKQIQLQQQQQIQLTVMNGNAGSHEPETSDSVLAAHNVNVARNINNNIVIKSDGRSDGTTTAANGVFGPSNTVILGEHPATLVLNRVIESDGNHQSTSSLPNFVGTFVQPHLVFSSQTMKPFVIDSNSLMIPQQVKVENGPVDGSTMTRTTNGDAAVITNATPTVDGHKVTIVSGDGENDYVTLHVSQDENMVDNAFDPLGQNDDISKLFKQQPNAEHSVDDVLQLLIKNGEFHPPESEPSPANARFDVAPPATTVADSATSMYTTTTASSTDLNVPSQHLSLEELGIEVETFPMDLGDEEQPDGADTTGVAPNAELMDVDTGWLDRLISSELDQSTTNSSTSTNDNYESMLNNNVTDPLDFFSMDDNDFKIAAEFSWDRVDFATS